MKAFFYAGAVLMTGAIIYGFVDYNKSRHSQGFTNLYKTETRATEKRAITPVNASDVKESKPASEVSVTPGTSEKTNLTPSAFAPLTSESVKKKKTISYKSFSRARIVEVRDQELNPVIKVLRQ